MTENNKIIIFQEREIRRTLHEGEWWYAINDVIGLLTDSVNPADYFRKMMARDIELQKGVGQNVRPLPIETTRGKQRLKCADRKTLFRIIMSVPSSKAEPFRRWFAEVADERIEEIENPELAVERAREIYKAKGYSDEWIEMRLKSIDIRKELTDEWQRRGVKEGQEYAILTAEIAKATFGVTPTEHKAIKNLEKQNLRDHMTRLELIFTMLGEESTRQIAVEDDALGFDENYDAAQKGGTAAGKARDAYEKTRNTKVISPENFLGLSNDLNDLPEAE